MFDEKTDNERILRWMLKRINPAAYAQHHAEVLMAQLYQKPKEECSKHE